MRRRRTARRWLAAIALPVAAALGAVAIGWMLGMVRPWVPAALTRLHPRDCAQARAAGFGNARIGEPGYFAHLDADGDGISCEPMPGLGPRR